jgi:hypothetical protein
MSHGSGAVNSAPAMSAVTVPDSLHKEKSFSAEEECEDKRYKLANVSSVKDVWQEYYHGINSGPSILSLETSKRKWRYPGSAETKRLSRRKILIKHISDKVKETGKTDKDVIELLDHERGKKALTSYVEELSKRMKEEKAKASVASIDLVE